MKVKRVTQYLRYRVRKSIGLDRKIFIIGRNKTGTTSLERCLVSLGYYPGNQIRGELFVDDYAAGNFENILKFCDSAEFFQDAPFSWPGTYRHVFKKYPDARYILLERASAEEWYDSLVRFHKKLVETDGPLTAELVKRCDYRREGFLWQVQRAVYKVDETNLYDKEIYIANYEAHNREVKEFFEVNGNFLSLVLSDQDSRHRLASFLGRRVDEVIIPHLNRSR